MKMRHLGLGGWWGLLLAGLLFGIGCQKKTGGAGDTNAVAMAAATDVTETAAVPAPAPEPEPAVADMLPTNSATIAAADLSPVDQDATSGAPAAGTSDEPDAGRATTDDIASATGSTGEAVATQINPLDLLKGFKVKVETLEKENEELKLTAAESRKAIKDLEDQVAGLKKENTTFKSEKEQAVADLERIKADNARLVAENERLSKLDVVEYARVVKLAETSPEEGFKEIQLFIAQFPKSALRTHAQAKLDEIEDKVEEIRDERRRQEARQRDPWVNRVPLRLEGVSPTNQP